MHPAISRRWAFLQEIRQRLLARVLLALWALSGIWDLALSQWIPEESAKHLPKVYQAAAMTAGLASWQAWLLAGAAITVIVVIEYAFRRTLPSSHEHNTSEPSKSATVPATLTHPTLLTLFMTDFNVKDRITWEATADLDLVTGDKKTQLRIFYKIVSDVDANAKFIAFFVPYFNPPSDMFSFLAANYKGYLDDIETKHWAVMKSQGTSDLVNTRNLSFSGRVYVYHENPMSLEQMAAVTKAFRENGATVLLRGHDHVVAVWQAIHSGAAKPPLAYEIRDGVPRLAN